MRYVASSKASQSAWNPSFAGLAIVLNGGSVTYTAAYVVIENLVNWIARIMPAGGATTQSALGATRLSNLPFAIASPGALCSAVNVSTFEDYGNGLGHPTASYIYMPAWAATTSEIVISGMYIKRP